MSDPIKGVMLADRPGGISASSPFKPSSATESLTPLGYTITQDLADFALDELAPANVNYIHKLWLREVEKRRHASQAQLEKQQTEEAKKAESVSHFNAKLRSTILAGRDVSFWRPAMRHAGSTGPHAKEHTHGEVPEDSQQSEFMPAPDVHPAHDTSLPACNATHSLSRKTTPVSVTAAGEAMATQHTGADTGGRAPLPAGTGHKVKSSGKAGSRGCVSTKPAWALTEKEVVHAADAEEEELLAFADSLDFDRFMSTLDDLELKDTLQALEEVEETHKGDDKAWRSSFVRAMRHVSRTRAAQASHPAARGADDCQSVAGMSEARSVMSCRSGRVAAPGSCKVDGDDGGWDASTKAGSDGVAVMEAVKSMHQADSFLRENPDLKATHSHASVRAMLSRTGPADRSP
ncbi:hypothetical protein V8C86DRAFT_2777055 [Haematococcus lacustris]